MKLNKLIALLALFSYACLSTQAQESEPMDIAVNEFAFPIGTKFTIKLVPVDSVNYDFSIVSIEPLNEVIDIHKSSALFSPKGEENTIVFLFGVGTFGDLDSKNGNANQKQRTFLVTKSYSDESLRLVSEIQREKGGDYKRISNFGLLPGTVSTEMWSYTINAINLSGFQKK